MVHLFSRKTISTSVFMLFFSMGAPITVVNVAAQEADKPLDLTILSTNEESVSFVVVEQSSPAKQEQPEQEQADPELGDQIAITDNQSLPTGDSDN